MGLGGHRDYKMDNSELTERVILEGSIIPYLEPLLDNIKQKELNQTEFLEEHIVTKLMTISNSGISEQQTILELTKQIQQYGEKISDTFSAYKEIIEQLCIVISKVTEILSEQTETIKKLNNIK